MGDVGYANALDGLGLDETHRTVVIENPPGWQFWNADDPLFASRVYDDIQSQGSAEYDVIYSHRPLKDRPKTPWFTREWGDFPDDWNAQNSVSRIHGLKGAVFTASDGRVHLLDNRFTYGETEFPVRGGRLVLTLEPLALAVVELP